MVPGEHADVSDSFRPPRPARHHVAVENERSTPRGWVFDVILSPRSAGPSDRREVSLSWADYEYWSHGAASPARVVEVVMLAVAELLPDAELPARFDASTLRRLLGGSRLDDFLHTRL